MSTTKTAKVTKSDLIDAFDDILTIFDFDDLPDTETATIKELVTFIEEKQDTDDCFNDDDFEIVDGRATALSIDTVSTLIKAGVTVPETWAEKLASVVTKKSAKKVKKSKEEQEYEEALKEAENETVEETVADIEKLEEITKDVEDEDEDEDEEEVKPAKKSSKKDSRSEKRAIRIKAYEKLFKRGCDKETVIKEILKLETGASISTIRTEISDSKNRKYNKLSKLVVEKDGILKFED